MELALLERNPGTLAVGIVLAVLVTGLLIDQEYGIVPAAGSRLWIAMPMALVTSAAVWELSMDQPTTRREKASRTTAQ